MQYPNKGNWVKLIKLLTSLKEIQDEVFTLEVDDRETLTWYIDVTFAVHYDMKSHTGTMFIVRKGCIRGDST